MKLYTLPTALILTLAVTATSSMASDFAPRHIVFASNPKFPSTEKSEKGEVESASNKEERSRRLIDAQYTSIADFRKQSGGAAAVPVMINGKPLAPVTNTEQLYSTSQLI
ncbi:hypothetical protein [Pseudomonas sp. O230]|uniref:hypothetical protein n=1 Tax=Pseudomonas sp. O230 TaxID=3159450 RepID=UPI00387B6CB2